MKDTRHVRLTIVTTLYQSADTIEEFYRRVMAAAEPLQHCVELVMVNDGSPDDSLDLALALHRSDPRVTVIDLARNFGHHKAIMTGLAYASGDIVFLIDSDLEEYPEEITRFYERLAQGDCDVVYGVQKSRRGGIFERVSGALFYSLMELLSDDAMPRNHVVVRLMKRQYVRALVRHRDREFVIAHLWQMAGFRQVPLVVEKLSRSPTTYSLGRRIKLAVQYLTTTSTKLLHVILYAGIAIFGLSVLMVLYFLGRYFTTGIGVDGFTSVIVSIWLLGGFITLSVGVMSIYVANILLETKRRPYTVVRQVHRAEGAAAGTSLIRVPAPSQRQDPGSS
jgi:putative glycosyltransferase